MAQYQEQEIHSNLFKEDPDLILDDLSEDLNQTLPLPSISYGPDYGIQPEDKLNTSVDDLLRNRDDLLMNSDLNKSFYGENQMYGGRDHNRQPIREQVENIQNQAEGAQQGVQEVIRRTVPEELTWNDLNTAKREYFRVRKIAYQQRRVRGLADPLYNPDERWSNLSMNQKIKRKKKGVVKQRLRDAAIQFLTERPNAQNQLHGPDALPVVPNDPNEEEIQRFLAIDLGAFRMNDDQEFIDHLADNYAAVSGIARMEQFLDRVESGEAELNAELMENISKKVVYLKELKEWMDARLDLIQDPYYVLISSKELADSDKVLEGLKSMQGEYQGDDVEGQRAMPNVKQYLERYDRVRKCTFNRRRLRDVNDRTYRAEFQELMNERGDAKYREISTRIQIRREKAIREGWQNRARVAMLEEIQHRPLEWHEERVGIQEFRKKSELFLTIDLSQFHFDSIDAILTNHKTHNDLFEQAKEMQGMLSEVSQEDSIGIDDEDLIKVQARLALFGKLQHRQTKILLELTKKDSALDNISTDEWISRHNLVVRMNLREEEENYCNVYKAWYGANENRIQEMYKQLKPGQEIFGNELEQAKKNFRKNLIFWESMKAAKMELAAQDEETNAFLNSYYLNQNREIPTISKHLLVHLRGKSKVEKVAILQKYSGTPKERMELEKKIADNALAETKHLEAFRVNPDSPEYFLQNIAYKLHLSEMLASAKEVVNEIDQIHKNFPNEAVPDQYGEEYRKELTALSEFAQDHIVERMKIMTDVADQVDTAYLGTVDIRKFKAIKKDRDDIIKALEEQAEEQQAEARTAAKVLFTTADKLFKNKAEIRNIAQVEKQKVASADAFLDDIYQTYRLAHGIQAKLNELEAAKKKKMLGQIDEISTDPVYSSREELQTLRDRCIAVLSKYEKAVPEYEYYDLPTPLLKELATRKLRDNADSKTIQKEIDRYQAAGLHMEKVEKQPEWREKEKNAILLMGNLAGMEERKEEDGADLLLLLNDHAEIIADMARIAMSDAAKRKADRKRYRELKQKVELGENLKEILQEEEAYLLEMRNRVKNATKKERKDTKYMDYLKSQVTMHQEQVDSVRKRMKDWEKNQAVYRKELEGLSYLDDIQKEDPEVPLDVFGSMSRRLEGLDGSIAKEIGTALSDIVTFLVQKSKNKVLNLESVRNLLRQKDPKLTELLKQAKSRIKASMDKLYTDVCKEVREVTPFMFENLNEGELNLMEGSHFSISGGDDVKRDYYTKKYEKEDAEKDAEIEKTIQENTNKELKELFSQYNVKLLNNTEQKKFEEKYKTILQKRDEKLSKIGPDARYMEQAAAVFYATHIQSSQKQEITLKMLHNQNWAYDPKTEEQPGEGTFVRNVMRNYFEKAHEKDRRSMLKSMFFALKPMIRDHKHVRINSLKQTGMHLAGLLRGAGPLLQKFMQGVPQHYLMTELSEAVEDMKSNLEPIPDSYVNQMFEKMKVDSKGEITEIKKLQSLGAASVGQTFLCRVKGKNYPNGKQVVIKILRPHVEERIDREEKIMKDCAKATSKGMLATYEGQLTKVREELDLRTEAANVRLGVKVYEKDDKDATGISRSVHVIKEIPPAKEYLVLDKAEGEPFDRYLNRISRNRRQSKKPFQSFTYDAFTGERHIQYDLKITPENVKKYPEIRKGLVKDLQSVVKRRVHLEKVTELWIRESLFGGGFYHGDMHAGNLMSNDDQATILDYGNATQLKQDEVKRVLALYATAMYGDARLFLDVFLGCLPEDQLKTLDGSNCKDPKEQFEKVKAFTILKNKLRKKLFRIFRRGDESQTGDKVDLALTELQKYGFQVPITIYSFVQSQIRLNNTLEDLNDQEIGLRNDIYELDNVQFKSTESTTTADLLMLAHMGAQKTDEKKSYYTALLQALEEPKEAEFLKLIQNKQKDEDGKTAFEKKYMGIFDKVNKLMSGGATYERKDPTAFDEEGEIQELPIPKINVNEWKNDYKKYLDLMKEDKENTLDGKPNEAIHKKFTNARKTLSAKLCNVFCLPTDASKSNGLLEGFGNHFDIVGYVGNALEGKKEGFDTFVDLIVNKALPLIELAKDLRNFINGDKKKDPAGLFKRYKDMAGILAEQHEVISNSRIAISFDRYDTAEDRTDPASLSIEETDTTQFKRIYPEWRKLYYRQRMSIKQLTQKEEEKMKRELQLTQEEEQKMKEPLTSEEEQKMNSLWEDLRECRRVGRSLYGVRVRCQDTDYQINRWFRDEEEGKDLSNAYMIFVECRNKDMEARDKKWNDDTYLKERIEAEKRFFKIYRRIGVRHLKEQMKAFDLEVPQKDQELRDFNTIFEGVVKSFNPFTLMDKAKLVGVPRAGMYLSGNYMGGLDLEDTIPEKPGEVPKIITRDKNNPWSLEEEEMEEEQERREREEKLKKEMEKKEREGINEGQDQNEIYEEPKNEIIL